MNENKKNDHDCWIQNKRCATGCTFYFVLSRPCACYVLIGVKWSVMGTVTCYEWSYEWRLNLSTSQLIFWVHSKTQGASLSTWMIDSHELEHHSRLVQHMSGWVLDSFSNRYIRTSLIYSNYFKHMNGWFTRTGASRTDSVQWVPVTMLTIALIVRTIDFYTHFSKNTNLETETSLPII